MATSVRFLAILALAAGLSTRAIGSDAFQDDEGRGTP
jgi:hypothetical protein